MAAVGQVDGWIDDHDAAAGRNNEKEKKKVTADIIMRPMMMAWRGSLKSSNR